MINKLASRCSGNGVCTMRALWSAIERRMNHGLSKTGFAVKFSLEFSSSIEFHRLRQDFIEIHRDSQCSIGLHKTSHDSNEHTGAPKSWSFSSRWLTKPSRGVHQLKTRIWSLGHLVPIFLSHATWLLLSIFSCSPPIFSFNWTALSSFSFNFFAAIILNHPESFSVWTWLKRFILFCVLFKLFFINYARQTVPSKFHPAHERLDAEVQALNIPVEFHFLSWLMHGKPAQLQALARWHAI